MRKTMYFKVFFKFVSFGQYCSYTHMNIIENCVGVCVATTVDPKF